MQTKLQSLVEIVCSLLVGFFLAMGLQMLLAYLYHVPMTIRQNFEWTIWFTLLSIARGYAFRRFFNWLHGKQNDTSIRTMPRQGDDYRRGPR
jgi:hypothetical protein